VPRRLGAVLAARAGAVLVPGRAESILEGGLTAAQCGVCLLGPLAYLAITEVDKWFERRSGEDTAKPTLAVAEAAQAEAGM
jgi:hypothetical protein